MHAKQRRCKRIGTKSGGAAKKMKNKMQEAKARTQVAVALRKTRHCEKAQEKSYLHSVAKESEVAEVKLSSCKVDSRSRRMQLRWSTCYRIMETRKG